MKRRALTITETNALACIPPIIVDHSEQLPWRPHLGPTADGTNYRFLATERAELATCDYALKGYETAFAIERKSLADAVSTACAGTRDEHDPKVWYPNWRRFRREMERLRGMGIGAGLVLIEAPRRAIWERRYVIPLGRDGKEAAGYKPSKILRQWDSVSVEFGVPVTWCESKREAEWIAGGAFVAVWERYLRGLPLEEALDIVNGARGLAPAMPHVNAGSISTPNTSATSIDSRLDTGRGRETTGGSLGAVAR